MDGCYTDDLTPGDHIHSDIQHATLRNHNRSTALERSVKDYWDGGLKPLFCTLYFYHHLFIYLRLVAASDRPPSKL